MSFDKSRMPCRVVIRKQKDSQREEEGDTLFFVFRDELTADAYSYAFPPDFYEWVCFGGYYNAFMCKRTTIH